MTHGKEIIYDDDLYNCPGSTVVVMLYTHFIHLLRADTQAPAHDGGHTGVSTLQNTGEPL